LFNLFLTYLGLILFISLGAQKNFPLSTLSESEIAYFKTLVEGNNRFAFDLYHRLKSDPGNIYFSSYSIISGLAMPAIGAKGETAHQFQRTFRYSPALLLLIGDLNQSLEKSSESKSQTQVLLANALWLDKSLSILPSFKQTFLRDFRENFQVVDFA